MLSPAGGVGGDRQIWRSFTALGRWAYLQGTNDGYLGYIQDDGMILWYGRVLNEIGTNMHSAFTEGGTAGAGILWMLGSSRIFRVDFDADGSPRTNLGGSHARGEASSSFILATPNTDLRNGKLLNKQKQARRFWVKTENWTSEASLTLRVHFDGDLVTLTTIGAAITTTGLHERLWTPGTSDLFYELMGVLRIDTTAGYSTASDPRIRAFGIEAVTASVYLLTIPLMPDRITGNRSADAMLKDLRALQNGATIKIREIGKPNTTFDAQIVSVAEQAVPVGVGQTGLIVQVHFERFSWDDGV